MTQTSRPAMYHTGIVVDDLETAMASYSEALGIEFAEPIPGTASLWTRACGALPRTDWFTYSIGGDHHIELVEQVDATAWEAAEDGPRLHHMGYFVEDLASEIARFESLGYTSEIRSETADGRTYMSYHRDPNGGLYIELVDADVARSVVPWWSGEGVGSFAERLAALGLDELTVREAFRNRRTRPLVAHDHGDH